MTSKVADRLRQALMLPVFRGSVAYWERRYRLGGNSGKGSYGALATFKAEVVNELIQREAVESIVEFGCGDGNQLSLMQYPRYLGLDVSRRAIELCCDRFRGDDTKSFLLYDPCSAANLSEFLKADLTLSLDVIYHLVEDRIYLSHLHNLFQIARRFVLIYSSNRDELRPAPHVRHRKFTEDIARLYPEFCLVRETENRYPQQSFARFYLFKRLAK